MALKLLLLAGYCFLFSVQICFRYSSESLDLDAYSSTLVIHGQAHHVAGPVDVHSRHGRPHHILNKRFEPVPEMAMPVQEIGITPVYGEVQFLLSAAGETVFTRDPLTSPQRGPPMEA